MVLVHSVEALALSQANLITLLVSLVLDVLADLNLLILLRDIACIT
jgi:hypothetical protein